MASEKTQDARLAISGDNLTVSCTNPDAGEIKDDIPIEYNGPDIGIDSMPNILSMLFLH